MNHCHQELELILVRRGTVEMICEGRKYVLDGGAVLIILLLPATVLREAARTANGWRFSWI